DRDGDLDIIANTLYGPFKVYTNHESQNNSVTFKLQDKKGNRFCLGCKIIIRYGLNGEKHQFREIKTGGGFHSYDAPLAHFGLGKTDTIKSIEITWSTGEATQIERNLPTNHEYIVQRKNNQ
ncbi:MAG: ASPIC/UnbV domain-containing protein, partial [Nitrospinota bacterium]|nr:ASPIC/UnbV domain-containing protein [Nitrospinota bacterium]